MHSINTSKTSLTPSPSERSFRAFHVLRFWVFHGTASSWISCQSWCHKPIYDEIFPSNSVKGFKLPLKEKVLSDWVSPDPLISHDDPYFAIAI
jgi:hypothetical protein